MKVNLIKIFLLLIFTPAFVSSQWVQVNTGISNTLNSVFFINGNTGYIAGMNIILKSTDAGETWSEQTHSTENFSIIFINDQNGFLGNSNGISKTTNGGNTWANIYSSNQIRKIKSANDLLIAVGTDNTILKSVDSGNTWQDINIQNQINTNWFEVEIISPTTYYVTGDEGKFFITNDAGVSWIDRSTGMPNPFFAISFINQNTGWLTGCCGMYFKTSDAGVNWTPEFYITKGYSISKSIFLNNDTGYFVADAGKILRTFNSGESWDSLISGTTNDLKDIFFLNENVAFTVGTFGTILKTTNGGGTGFPINVHNISNSIPKSFFVNQNYPNPFNPSTKIPFQISSSSNLDFSVYDSQGKIVYSNSYKNLSPGIYEYEFKAHNLPSGVYFFTISNNEHSQSLKILLLK